MVPGVSKSRNNICTAVAVSQSTIAVVWWCPLPGYRIQCKGIGGASNYSELGGGLAARVAAHSSLEEGIADFIVSVEVCCNL